MKGSQVIQPLTRIDLKLTQLEMLANLSFHMIRSW